MTQEAYKSRASVVRELKISINASAVTPSGEGIQLVGNEVSITLQPATTPAVDPDGYYIVGDSQAGTQQCPTDEEGRSR